MNQTTPDEWSRLRAALSTLEHEAAPSASAVADATVWATHLVGKELAASLAGFDPATIVQRLIAVTDDSAATTCVALKGSKLDAALANTEASLVKLDTCGIGAKTLAALASTPRPMLRKLSIVRSRLKPAALETLCRSAVFPSVSSLSLAGNSLGDEGAELLARSTAFPALDSLDVGYTRFTADGVRTLLDSPALERLRVWRSGTDKLGPALGDVFASATGPRALHTVCLYSQKLGTAGLQALAKASVLSTVRQLSLMENSVTRRGIDALAASPHLSKIDSLRFRYDGIDDACLASIASAFVGLKRLQASQCRVSDDGVEALGRSKLALDVLHLGTNPGIGVAGFETLLRAPPFQSLHTLDLTGMPLGVGGVERLVRANPWPKLHTLSLSNAELSDESIDVLLDWPQLRQLKVLDLGTNEISASAVQKIVAVTKLQSLGLFQTPAADEVTHPSVSTELTHGPIVW